jgi:hypothetical protein
MSSRANSPNATIWSHEVASPDAPANSFRRKDLQISPAHLVLVADLNRGTGLRSTNNPSSSIDERVRKCGFQPPAPPATGIARRLSPHRCAHPQKRGQGQQGCGCFGQGRPEGTSGCSQGLRTFRTQLKRCCYSLPHLCPLTPSFPRTPAPPSARCAALQRHLSLPLAARLLHFDPCNTRHLTHPCTSIVHPPRPPPARVSPRRRHPAQQPSRPRGVAGRCRISRRRARVAPSGRAGQRPAMCKAREGGAGRRTGD